MALVSRNQTNAPGPRTPSPKIRIHRSQSFDSPSSRLSITPIDDSPYSKSASAIVVKPLPRYDVLSAGEVGAGRALLNKRLSEESMLSTSTTTSTSSTTSTSNNSSPTSPSQAHQTSQSQFALFSSGSPTLSMSSSSSPALSMSPHTSPPIHSTQQTPQILTSTLSLEIYQDHSTPMFDPWLVRVVLDMYDLRGFDWTMIAEPIERIWGFKTSSAEVLGILSGNGRVGRRWWD